MTLPHVIVYVTFLAGVSAGFSAAKAMLNWPPPPATVGVALLLVCVVVLMVALLEWFAIRIAKEILVSRANTDEKVRMFKDVFEPVAKPLSVLKDLASVAKGGS
jgi:divalent metal cation (Fe/Co/Zn/Cd) transporter